MKRYGIILGLLASFLIGAPVPALASPAAFRGGYGARNVELGNNDNGREVRVHAGEQVDVTLTVDPRQYPDPAVWWGAIVLTGNALSRIPQNIMPVRGHTVGRFVAVHPGNSELTSKRAVCPPSKDHPTCHAVQGWSVTIDVD